MGQDHGLHLKVVTLFLIHASRRIIAQESLNKKNSRIFSSNRVCMLDKYLIH